MKNALETLLRHALDALPEEQLPAALRSQPIELERTRDAAHGDYATNVAMRHAKAARQNPRQLAEAIIAALPANTLVARAELAGPGFINFHLTDESFANELVRVLDEGDAYGRSDVGRGERVLVEFVSANPTGPLHVGHGRQAAYGATLAALLSATGHAVSREYYVNDAGRQVDILTLSAWLRYLELHGQTLPFPSNGYRGDYVRELATALTDAYGTGLVADAAAVFAGVTPDEPAGGDKELHVDALIARMREQIGADGYDKVLELSLKRMTDSIRQGLADFGVEFETFFSERSLATNGAIDRSLARLRSQGRLYEKDGATWFRATEFGDEKDRVVIRENGAKTYFASDIAYHLDKRERGFERLLDVLGADHHGYVARVRAGLEAMGEPGDSLEVTLIQFVNLFRGTERVPMGKREGQFVTLEQLRTEVGSDACRFFYLMRSQEQPLDFDLELAKSRSAENPVYYVQYAYARGQSVFRQLADRGLPFDEPLGRQSLGQLRGAHERRLLSQMTRFPEVLRSAAIARAPHMMVTYLRDLATEFHAAYNAGNEAAAARFIVDDPAVRNARLCLVRGACQVLANGLRLLGVSAPESM